MRNVLAVALEGGEALGVLVRLVASRLELGQGAQEPMQLLRVQLRAELAEPCTHATRVGLGGCELIVERGERGGACAPEVNLSERTLIRRRLEQIPFQR